jgi:NAD(P)-dependent dehydrogenase (short-subunit alcohol dehydrogenase family)
MNPTALITGGANGLGLRTAEYLAERGWTVFAADINQQALDDLPDPLIPIHMDVTDPTSIEAALDIVNQKADGLDGIVNCAGILVVGALIDVPEEDLRSILDVTLLGTYQVYKAFYPLVARSKGSHRQYELGNRLAVHSPLQRTLRHMQTRYRSVLRRPPPGADVGDFKLDIECKTGLQRI